MTRILTSYEPTPLDAECRDIDWSASPKGHAINRIEELEGLLDRERRRVRQRQRGLYQWGAVWWDECATLAFGRDDRETARRLVARSNRLFDMARDRSHDDE